MSFFLSTLLCVSLFSQTDEATRKLQIAQSLERAGDWQQAAVLYEDLWHGDSTNYVFFDALRRAYGQLKEYDKALALLDLRIRMRPSEFYLAAYIGGVLFDAGRREQADSSWNAMLTAQPRQRQLYALVAQQMQERRLFGRAIGTYKQGRTALGNEAEFSQELALLYSATQAYGDAVGEYVRMLEQTPHQLGYIQSRIASFTIREEGLRQAEPVVRSAVEKSPASIPLETLFAWILMEQGRYTDAFPVYRTIDSMTASKGSRLFTFADMAAREGYYAEASVAYSEIVHMDPPSPLRARALYGMAQTYEKTLSPHTAQATGSAQNGLSIPENVQPSDSALVLHARVIQEYPGSQPALESLFRIGVLRYERLFDLDGAIRAFDEIRNDPRAGNLAWEALLVATDVKLAKGDVPGASELLEQAPSQARAFLQDRFMLQQAWITYFRGEFGRAQALLQGAIASLTRDVANDGLSLYYHLQDGSSDSTALMTFARAELLVRQRQYGEALEHFRAVSITARTAMLASRSRLETAEMLVTLGKTSAAIQFLDSVVTTYQTDVLRDRALFRIGTLYEHELRNNDLARETYEKFLVLFPTSIFADAARQRARALRKDPL